MKRNSFLLFVLLLIALGALFFRFAPTRATRSASQLARNVGDSASQMVHSIASVVASPKVEDAPRDAVQAVTEESRTQIEYPVLTKENQADVVPESHQAEIEKAVALKFEEEKVLAAVNQELVQEEASSAGNAAQRASDLLTQAIKAADEAKAQMMIAQKELRADAKASLNLARTQTKAAAQSIKSSISVAAPQQVKAPEGVFGELESELSRNPVHFNWMKSTLDDESQVRLAKVARAIEKNPKADIQITGYTDNNGKPELNKWLGLVRARRVREQLVAQGVSPKRLSVSSEGANNPIATNDTPLGRWKNRRVEFSVAAK